MIPEAGRCMLGVANFKFNNEMKQFRMKKMALKPENPVLNVHLFRYR